MWLYLPNVRSTILKSCALIPLSLLPALPTTAQTSLPGRLSGLRLVGHRDSVTVANSGYSLDIQKMFKVHALTPELKSEVYGQRTYAGAMNLRTPGGEWLNALPADQYSINAVQTGQWLGEATQTAHVGAWTGTLTGKVAVGYPSLWFEYRRTSGEGAISAGLMGYQWAGRTAPLIWSAGNLTSLASIPRAAGSSVTIPISATTSPFFVIYHDAAGITGCLRFAAAPAEMHADDTGLYWSYSPDANNADVEYLPVSAAISDEQIATMADRLKAPPTALTQAFSSDAAGRPTLRITATGSNLALPASVTGNAKDVIDTVEGKIGISDANASLTTLPIPPQMEQLVPHFADLAPADQARVNGWIKGILAHQQPDGSFDFSLKRGFYDSMTCCSLAEVYPKLSPSMQAKVKPALRRGLDHLWSNLKPCETWPAYNVAPEQPFFIKTGVDYPEIMGFTLQATALYCKAVDRSYLATRWPQIARQFDQLRTYTDWTGGAFANPGPDFYQIIPEGSIGGYLGWHALYHLSGMRHDTALAAEAKARAAFAWQAFTTLYAWKPGFGNAVVNGINNGALEIKGSSPWNYFQYTWFTFLPAFSMPHEDTMHVWAMLDKLPWYEWTGTLKSRQRANDGANLTAFLRSGYPDSVKRHSTALSIRPVWYDAFDFTPALMIPATYWMQAEKTAKRQN